MKRLATAAVLALFFVFSFNAYAQEVSIPINPLDGFKEYVSENYENIPEISAILENLGVAEAFQDLLSSQNNDQIDYAVKLFSACKYDSKENKCLEDPYSFEVFYAVTAVKDEKGEIISYNAEPIVLVFGGPKIVWYQSENAKKMYKKLVLEEATL